jgi:hypothetical protein
MALDGISLGGAEPAFDIEITTHGCGENFPLDETGEELDAAPADGREDQVDRRVELFFFDKEFGIVPPAPGKNSPKGGSEYPEWRRRAEQSVDLEAEVQERLQVRLHDAESRPLPRANCVASIGEEALIALQADEEGFITLRLPPVCPTQIRLRYGPAGSTEPFPFACELIADCESGTEAEQDRQQLHNLGYSLDWEFEAAAARFQADYQIDHQPEPMGLVDGALPPATRARLAQIFEECDASLPV